MEVPLIVLVAELDPIQAEVMPEPGAATSTHGPQLEYEAPLSDDVVAATVIASGALEGEYLHASAFELPAATATGTPAPTIRETAALSDEEYPPPKLMLATAGRTLLAVTQSIPATTPEYVPDPEQSRTLTATRLTFLATPYVMPPIVPDTCVPWPLQSTPFPPKASNPKVAREPN
eukprot:Colp12_sorted_trinity150504_noHs@10415